MDLLSRLAPDTFTLVLLAALAIMLLWESAAPFRPLASDRNARWRANFALLIVGIVSVQLLVPVSLVALAQRAAASGWGLFNGFQLPAVIVLPLSCLLMDLGKYLQHLLMHRLPWLWRLHRTHHSDTEVDVTTSLRFHPLELVFTLAADAAVILAFGVPPVAVVLYRLVRVGVSTFVHGNVSLPRTVDRLLRWAVATPDFHRVHHSAVEAEQARNLSGGLIWWDRCFGTYLASSCEDPRTMRLGLADRDPATAHSIGGLLRDPAAG